MATEIGTRTDNQKLKLGKKSNILSLLPNAQYYGRSVQNQEPELFHTKNT